MLFLVFIVIKHRGLHRTQQLYTRGQQQYTSNILDRAQYMTLPSEEKVSL